MNKFDEQQNSLRIIEAPAVLVSNFSCCFELSLPPSLVLILDFCCCAHFLVFIGLFHVVLFVLWIKTAEFSLWYSGFHSQYIILRTHEHTWINSTSNKIPFGLLKPLRSSSRIFRVVLSFAQNSNTTSGSTLQPTQFQFTRTCKLKLAYDRKLTRTSLSLSATRKLHCPTNCNFTPTPASPSHTTATVCKKLQETNRKR